VAPAATLADTTIVSAASTMSAGADCGGAAGGCAAGRGPQAVSATATAISGEKRFTPVE
jgi:hypothetical protein